MHFSHTCLISALVIIPHLRKLAKKDKIKDAFTIPHEQRNIRLLLDYTSNYNFFLRKQPKEGEGEPSKPRKREPKENGSKSSRPRERKRKE